MQTTSPATSQPVPLQPGEPLPDFELLRLDGKALTRVQVEGKRLLLVFGSLSSPVVRDRLPGLGRLLGRWGRRINAYIVYTREAFPTPGRSVERNTREKISVAPHATLDDRTAAAKRLRDEFNPPCEVVVDRLDDALSHRLQGGENGAALFDPHLKLVLRQRWFDPAGVEFHLERSSG